MLQTKEIGKYRRKDSVLDAKCNRTFVTPQNREYSFDYCKIGRSYMFILTYRGHKLRIKESDFNRFDIDELLNSYDIELNKIESGYYDN